MSTDIWVFRSFVINHWSWFGSLIGTLIIKIVDYRKSHELDQGALLVVFVLCHYLVHFHCHSHSTQAVGVMLLSISLSFCVTIMGSRYHCHGHWYLTQAVGEYEKIGAKWNPDYFRCNHSVWVFFLFLSALVMMKHTVRLLLFKVC